MSGINFQAGRDLPELISFFIEEGIYQKGFLLSFHSIVFFWEKIDDDRIFGNRKK